MIFCDGFYEWHAEGIGLYLCAFTCVYASTCVFAHRSRSGAAKNEKTPYFFCSSEGGGKAERKREKVKTETEIETSRETETPLETETPPASKRLRTDNATATEKVQQGTAKAKHETGKVAKKGGKDDTETATQEYNAEKPKLLAITQIDKHVKEGGEYSSHQQKHPIMFAVSIHLRCVCL